MTDEPELDFDEEMRAVVEAANSIDPRAAAFALREGAQLLVKPIARSIEPKSGPGLSVELDLDVVQKFDSITSARAAARARPIRNIEKIGIDWIVTEFSAHGEAIRGRYATEAEAWERLKQLSPPPPKLSVEEITDTPPRRIWATPKYKRITVLLNTAEKCWLVLGWIPGEYDPEILERCKTEAAANLTARQLRRAQSTRKTP